MGRATASLHDCFRVGQDAFDAILTRLQAAGIAYRGKVHGPVDYRVNTVFGGKLVYWNEPVTISGKCSPSGMRGATRPATRVDNTHPMPARKDSIFRADPV